MIKICATNLQIGGWLTQVKIWSLKNRQNEECVSLSFEGEMTFLLQSNLKLHWSISCDLPIVSHKTYDIALITLNHVYIIIILGPSLVYSHKIILYLTPSNLKTYCSIFLKRSSVLIEFLNYYDYDKDVENKKLQVHFTLADVMNMTCQSIYVQLYLECSLSL